VLSALGISVVAFGVFVSDGSSMMPSALGGVSDGSMMPSALGGTTVVICWWSFVSQKRHGKVCCDLMHGW
jgi:hypothetical protein